MNTHLEHRENVSRNEVAGVVEALLLNEAVGTVVCKEQPNGTYHVIPHPREVQES